MNERSRVQVTIGALIVVVGLLIGAMIAILTRSSNQQTQQTSVAVRTPPRPAASRMPTHRSPASSTPTAAPTVVATPATPMPATRTPPTPTPAAATANAAAAAGAGTWRIDEANVYVGTIVWSGTGTASSGGAIVLDVHKERVAGHAVSQCERRTTLRVALAGASAQNAPYEEVNCSGATSNGEMRVTGFGADGRSFSGSFWTGGAKVGDFTALRT
jgi:cytoskeletal protein RodZ